MSYRTRDKLLLVGVQIDGTELALTGADAIRVAALKSKPTINTVQTNYHRGTTNKSVDEAGGGYSSITFTRLLTGSGVAGTPPREDRLLRGCGLKATAVAGAATLAVTAGSAMSVTLSLASTILAATPRGCVVVISAGTGIGQRRAVTGYDNTSKVVTVAGKWDTVPDATSKIDILQARSTRRGLTAMSGSPRGSTPATRSPPPKAGGRAQPRRWGRSPAAFPLATRWK